MLRPPVSTSGLGRPYYTVWRRLIVEEADRIETELNRCPRTFTGEEAEARTAERTLVEAQLAKARGYLPGPRQGFGHLSGAFRDLVVVWTGSEGESARAALHQADEALLMVAPTSQVVEAALNMQASVDLAHFASTDPRPEHYKTLFDNIRKAGETGQDVARNDRDALRSLRVEIHHRSRSARARVRIFRNVLTSAILLMLTVLVLLATLGRGAGTGMALRGPNVKPKGGDIAQVELLGAFGGLISGVAGLRSLRGYQRSYGLPLAQGLLKLPMGAAAALLAVLLSQNEILSSVKAQPWNVVVAEAILFGVAQIAVTKAVDNRASVLLGDAESKEAATQPPAPARASGLARPPES